MTDAELQAVMTSLYDVQRILQADADAPNPMSGVNAALHDLALVIEELETAQRERTAPAQHPSC
jgi:hypothetical protein